MGENKEKTAAALVARVEKALGVRVELYMPPLGRSNMASASGFAKLKAVLPQCVAASLTNDKTEQYLAQHYVDGDGNYYLLSLAKTISSTGTMSVSLTVTLDAHYKQIQNQSEK